VSKIASGTCGNSRQKPSRPARRNRLHKEVTSALLLGVVTALSLGCNQAADDRPWSNAEKRLVASLAGIPPLAKSPGNAFADNEDAALLGRSLFYDKRMSSNGKVACATCHAPELYFADGRKRAKGVGETPRAAPSVIGSQWLPFVFWDGRKDSLWAQSMGPLEAPPEHGFSRLGVLHHVNKHYKDAYTKLFGPLPPLEDGARFPPHARPVPDKTRDPHNKAWLAMSDADRHAVNKAFSNVGKSIEAFERKLLPRPSPFDAWAERLAKGNDGPTKEFSDLATRGLRQFIGSGGCVNCHNGQLFTDKSFHNIGLPRTEGVSGEDAGRTLGAASVKKDTFSCGGLYSDAKDCKELRFLNPKFEDFLGAFKTPSLRNVAKTAPYMHGGQFQTLAEVVDFYKKLPDKPRIGHRDLVLKQVDPDVDAKAVVAFLETLTGPLPDKKWLSGDGK